MAKQILNLVKNAKVMYVENKDAYVLLKSMSTPMIRVDENYLPLLADRCRKYKVKIAVKDFSTIEEDFQRKITDSWKYGFKIKGNKIAVEIPRKKSLKQTTERLVNYVKQFYQSHMFDVEVRVRKFPNKVSYILERKLNGERVPEWQEQETGNRKARSNKANQGIH
jgi:hypothetical protein